VHDYESAAASMPHDSSSSVIELYKMDPGQAVYASLYEQQLVVQHDAFQLFSSLDVHLPACSTWD
jgi:hypothetical protein